MSLYPAGYYRPRHPGPGERDLARAAGARRPRSTSQRGAATASPIAPCPTRPWSIRRSSPARHYRRERARRRRQPQRRRRPGRADLAATDELIAAHRRLVEQALRLFGARHYDQYEFLLALPTSSAASASSICARPRTAVKPDYFTDWDKRSARPRPAAARIHPQLERQVSPPRRAVDARLPDADAGQPALGL